MGFDIFISYSSKDKPVADAVCARLESAGIRCWIAPRDVLAGTSYGEAIIEAIHQAQVMVLVFSSNANSSGHIPKEVERAVSRGLAILPFRIENVAPGKSLDYFIGSVHWLDAMTPPLEKHLDELVTTIHRLIPGKPEGPGTPLGAGSAEWQRAVSRGVGGTTQMPGTRTDAETSHGGTQKTMWIGVAAVALIVAGAMWLRQGRTSQSADTAQSSYSTPSIANPPSNPAAPRTVAAEKVRRNAIVGCYRWFNNQPVVIHADGTMAGGPFTGHWRQVSAATREYMFTWPEATDTVTIASNQQSLSGSNQYGFPASGARISGGTGLVGTWRWPNGVPVVVSADGAFTAATFRGRWRAMDISRGIYTLTWPNPVDHVTLSSDGSRISGANQYGVAISGVKTDPCAEN